MQCILTLQQCNKLIYISIIGFGIPFESCSFVIEKMIKKSQIIKN